MKPDDYLARFLSPVRGSSFYSFKITSIKPDLLGSSKGCRDIDITEIDITESDVTENDITEIDITDSDITESDIT